MRKYFSQAIFFPILFISISFTSYTSSMASDSLYFTQNYTKQEVRIQMRDGVKLFTAIYSPNNNSENHPIILWRTPYSCQPYGEDKFFSRRLNTFFHFIENNYIVVIQDVRGRFMSEGKFIDMRPYLPNKKGDNEFDESSDAYDTVEWLVNNTKHNNGKVGVWGISYPGFYAAMAAIDSHPAIKAVSPQAPIADWYIGDDMHHNGALSLLMNFTFFDVFGLPRPELIKEWPKGIEYPTIDAYSFFKNLGPIKNVNTNYFKNSISFWDSLITHSNYDNYWKTKSTLSHFNNIKPAILSVGGWFDGENLYGALNTYKSIEDKNDNIKNHLVIGPWPHGGWTRIDGDKFGDISFGSKTSEYYVVNIELPFFNYYLKGDKNPNLPEAYIFETGSNIWHKFNEWPPSNAKEESLFLNENGSLDFYSNYTKNLDFDEYLSDPDKPVPYTAKIMDSKDFYNKEYMIEDQRFTSTRSDVLVFETEPLKTNISITGPIETEFFVSTSGTDSDWIVKVIDVFPEGSASIEGNDNEIIMAGYQMLLRGEILRGRYRNSFEFPAPMIPNEITKISIRLNDVYHTFKKGHKIMLQIQSSWFPMYDINPQTYVNIYEADKEDFQKAIQRIYYGNEYPSKITFSVIE